MAIAGLLETFGATRGWGSSKGAGENRQLEFGGENPVGGCMGRRSGFLYSTANKLSVSFFRKNPYHPWATQWIASNKTFSIFSHSGQRMVKVVCRPVSLRYMYLGRTVVLSDSRHHSGRLALLSHFFYTLVSVFPNFANLGSFRLFLVHRECPIGP